MSIAINSSIAGYLIFHPQRQEENCNGTIIYHDGFGWGNSDPYVWNDQFLHTFCHITQMRPEAGHINFWVSSGQPRLKGFTQLFCDLVFVVDGEGRRYWKEPNAISPEDSLVDSHLVYNEHYQYGNLQEDEVHSFKRRRRYTLKADSTRSFQPQNSNGELINILNFLEEAGLSQQQIEQGMWSGTNSKPIPLTPEVVDHVYRRLLKSAKVMLRGADIAPLHPKHPGTNTLDRCLTPRQSKKKPHGGGCDR